MVCFSHRPPSYLLTSLLHSIHATASFSRWNVSNWYFLKCIRFLLRGSHIKIMLNSYWNFVSHGSCSNIWNWTFECWNFTYLKTELENCLLFWTRYHDTWCKIILYIGKFGSVFGMSVITHFVLKVLVKSQLELNIGSKEKQKFTHYFVD